MAIALTALEVEKVGVQEIEKSVRLVAAPWEDSPYYEQAEQSVHIFWGSLSIFRRLFERLDLRATVELACGHGRHAAQIVDQAGSLTLIDVFDANLSFCAERFRGNKTVSFIKGGGYTFEPIEPESATAIYCYDAMVHFSPDIVESYLRDAFRILKPGGMILLHHSNYDTQGDQRHYGQNPHARNHMTKALFSSLVNQSGLEVLESTCIPWGDVAELDCVSLLQKP